MTITKNREESALTLSLSGRLDTTTAPELENEVRTSLDGVTELTFDFRELEYISSAGLRVLLLTQKMMSKCGKLTVMNVCDEIREVFDITGFSDILNIV